VTGYGFDTSVAAIAKAKRSAFGLPLQFSVLSTAHPLPLPDAGTHLALDLMASHYLDSQGRTALRDELHRVLVPGGFLLMKTFLRDDDLHTERLLQDYPGPELGTYIHPVIGVPEYVYDEATLTEFLSERFLIHKIYRSHQHRSHGKARKRRTVSVYAQKDPYQ
jgi:SAM-dependent methyltransferase